MGGCGVESVLSVIVGCGAALVLSGEVSIWEEVAEEGVNG